MVPKCLPNGSLEASWSVLASWRPPGALRNVPCEHLLVILARKKVLLNASWPLQEDFQERFQPSWRRKAPQRDAKMVQNGAQEAIGAQDGET